MHLFEVPGVSFCWERGGRGSPWCHFIHGFVFEKETCLSSNKNQNASLHLKIHALKALLLIFPWGQNPTAAATFRCDLPIFVGFLGFPRCFFVQVTGDNPAVEGLRVYQTAWYLRLAETPLLSPPFFSIFPCGVETKIDAV